jgi:hypothetical protein
VNIASARCTSSVHTKVHARAKNVSDLATHIPSSTLRMFLRWAWRENDRLRRVASATLVDAALAAGVGRFVQESFAPVYPDCGDRWIDETVPIEPVRYNRTVADAEAAATRFSQHGGSGIVLRFGGFYGPDALQTIAMIDAVRRGWGPVPGLPNAFISSVMHLANGKLRAACDWRPTYESVRQGWPAVVAQIHASTAREHRTAA